MTSNKVRPTYSFSFIGTPAKSEASPFLHRCCSQVLSIRITLPFLLVSQVIVAILVTWALGFLSTQYSVSAVSKELDEQVHYRTAEAAQSVLVTPENMVKKLYGSYLAGVYTLNEPNVLRGVTYSVISNFPTFSTTYFNLVNGYYIGYRRDEASNALGLVIKNTTTEYGTLYRLGVNSDGTPNNEGVAFSNFTNRGAGNTIDLAIAAGRYSYTPVRMLSNGNLAVSAIMPIFDRIDRKTVQGAASIDLFLVSLSKYISSINISPNSKLLVMDMDDLLIASSTGELTTTDRISPLESKDPLIKRVATYVIGQYGSFAKMVTSNNTISRAEFGDYQISASRFTYSNGDIQWTIFLIIPTSDFMGEAYTIFIVIAICTVALMCLSIVASCILSICITQPLYSMSAAFNKISQMQLDKVAAKRSRLQFHEMKNIEGSFKNMVYALESFRKYVPEAVIKQTILSNQVADVSLESMPSISVAFLDIADFTAYAEALPASTLVMLVGRAMEEFSSIIMEEGGIIDKYIGDCIMSLYNVCNEIPDHQEVAVRVALRSLKKLQQLHEEWLDQGLPMLNCRIGIHSGKALVGNFGSKNRLNFTAIGDTINLAARLEPLNKNYGTNIIISEQVQQAVKQSIVCRPVDSVIVKGKTQSTVIYEPICLRSEATTVCLAQEEMGNSWITSFLNGDIRAAFQVLEELQASHLQPDTVVTKMYQRCKEYLANPDHTSLSNKFDQKEF